MDLINDNRLCCLDFEACLTDYLDRSLEVDVHKLMAAHAMSCPLCHALLNDVRASLSVCREMADTRVSLTHLEARILEKTAPRSIMHCEQFEELLTDYLDGFLPAHVFHRWERHAVLCDECTDLPGTVVRSIAACVAYKLDELPVPAGLNQAILRQTIGLERRAATGRSAVDAVSEWLRGLRLPISVPQLAPVAMMLVLALLIFSQTVSTDGSLSGVYATSYELAKQSYIQGADALGPASGANVPASQIEPITGTTYVGSPQR